MATAIALVRGARISVSPVAKAMHGLGIILLSLRQALSYTTPDTTALIYTDKLASATGNNTVLS